MTFHPFVHSFVLSALLTSTLVACGDNDERRPCRDKTVSAVDLQGGYCVTARVSGASGVAFALGDDGLLALQSNQQSAGTELAVSHYAFDSATADAFDSVLGVTVDGKAPIYPSQYLARSSKGDLAFGYTRADFSGAIYLAHTAAKIDVIQGNSFDAAFLDSETLLVDGTSVEVVNGGQGVYVKRSGENPQRIIQDLGSASGYVAVGDDVVFVGGAFGTYPNIKNRVYAFSRDQVVAAIKAGSALSAENDGVLAYAGDIVDATAVGNDLIVVDSGYDANFKPVFAAVRRYPTTVSGQTVTVGASELVANSNGQGRVTSVDANGQDVVLRVESNPAQASGNSQAPTTDTVLIRQR